jgi:hypothetical protein
MSFVFPAHLMVDATRALACSALPDAPVEPDRVRTRRHPLTFLRALFRPATDPVRVTRLVDQCAARQA